MYRPLFLVTNSNPMILTVKKKLVYDIDHKFQTAKILLVPTGKKWGVTSVSIRSILSSSQCARRIAMTWIVQVHRDAGRRLWVNFP